MTVTHDPQDDVRTTANGWRLVPLGKICELRIETRDPTRTPEVPFRYVDISGVDNTRKRIVDARTMLGGNAPSRARQVIRTEDVLVATTRPNLNAVALVPSELDQEICSTGFCVLRPVRGIVESGYLFAFVQTDAFVDSLTSLVKGALYLAVTEKQVLAQHIPLPSLPEQRRIAAILTERMEAVERARNAAEAQLETVRHLPAALLREAFSGRL